MSRHDMWQLRDDLEFEGRTIERLVRHSHQHQQRRPIVADTEKDPPTEETAEAERDAPKTHKEYTEKELADRRAKHKAKFSGEHPLEIGTRVRLPDTPGAITSPQRSAKIMDFAHGDHQYVVQFDDSKGVTSTREVPEASVI